MSRSSDQDHVELGRLRANERDHRTHEEPSNKIWPLYVQESSLHDKGLVEGWKSDMDGLLIFAGLFSASVTALIVESYKNLQPDSTQVLLNNITMQLFQMSNGTKAIGLPLSSEVFTADNNAVRVNYCWFLSLTFGLICALAATLVQQWARSYLQAIERHPSPEKKARVRSYLYYGVEKFRMKSTVEAVPVLLHIAVFLFFAGLVEFLFGINNNDNANMAITILVVVIVFGIIYLVITLLPTIYRHCPYRTPLSHLCWRLFQVLHILRYQTGRGKSAPIHGGMTEGRQMLATRDLPGRNQRDADALQWTMQHLTEASQLESIIEGIPTFFEGFPSESSAPIAKLTVGLMHRISSVLKTCRGIPSSALTNSEFQRIDICIRAFKTLVEIAEVPEWTEDWIIAVEGVIRALQNFDLQAHPANAIIVRAVDNTIASLLDRLVTWTQRTDDVVSLSHQWQAKEEVKGALHCFESLNAQDAIVEMIPDFVTTRNTSYNKAEKYRLGEILLQCQNKYIPRLLESVIIAYPTHGLVMQTARRERRAMACMHAIRVVGSDLHFNIDNAKALTSLKNDQRSSIAHFANCTAARIACQVQLGIMLSTRISPSKDRFLKCHATLDALDLLAGMGDGENFVSLRKQLRLGLDFQPPQSMLKADTDALWSQVLNVLPHVDDHSPLYPDDESLLEQLQLRIGSGGQECPRRYKLTLTRGRTVILVAFLQSMAASLESAIPDQELLDTLRYITKSTLPRFACPRIQTSLVELSGQIVRHLMAHHFVEHEELVRHIVETLFDVLHSVGDLESIVKVKEIIRDYLRMDPGSEEARQALETLESTTPVDTNYYH